MELTGAQRKQLQLVLLSAFPTEASLQQLVSYQLNENLAEIAGDGPLEALVFTLIEWARAHDRLEDLIKGAVAENSDNQDLHNFALETGVREDSTSSARNSAVEKPRRGASGHARKPATKVASKCGVLVLRSESELAQINGCGFYVDGQRVKLIDTTVSSEFEIEPGFHIIQIVGTLLDRSNKLGLVVKPGEKIYIIVSYSAFSFFNFRIRVFESG